MIIESLTPAIERKLAIRARNMVWLSFILMGIVLIAWVPRIPEIKHSLLLSNSQFGFILVGGPLGLLAGAQLSGRLIHQFGTKKIAFLSGPLSSLSLVLLSNAHSRWTLFGSLFVMGFGYSGIDNAMNTQGVAIERILNRKYMSSFHGCWSLGALCSTLIGGFLAHKVSPHTNLLGIAIVTFFAFIPLLSNLLPKSLDGHRGHEEGMSAKLAWFGKGTGLMWLMGIGLIGCLIPEGSATDWAGILLHEHMHIATGLDASAFACFTIAMIVGRFSGDWLMMKFSPQRVVKLGGYIGGAAFGLGIAMAIPLSTSHQKVALVIINIGFAIAGFGIAPMVPAFVSATGRIPGIAPSIAIARISVISLFSYYVGPIVTGGLADAINLPVAMAFPSLVLILTGYLSRTIRS
ncbi:MAG: MFS transporter [Actinomycetes bacterium]